MIFKLIMDYSGEGKYQLLGIFEKRQKVGKILEDPWGRKSMKRYAERKNYFGLGLFAVLSPISSCRDTTALAGEVDSSIL